ncbi:MAG: sulfatase-like hydrolase/transferase, partial [Polyangiaceae bacterium]|nr:sulfatase-like hydrolase/transferase [Polyangiaceae bacterium]
MKAQIASGVLAGVVGGLVAALLEILFASSSSLQTAALSLVVVLGLGLPFGILTGLGLIALPLVLPKGARPKALAEALLTREAPATTGWIIGVGLVALAALPLYYRLVLFFHTAFHHVGLTVLAECLTLLVFFAGVALFARGAGLLTGVVLAHTPRILSWARRPAVALGIVAAIWLACLAPPVLSGPDAKGVFGFMGLVRKDGLGALPLVTVAAMIAAASLTLVPLLSRSGRPLVVAALLAVPISIAGLLLANGVLDYQPIVGDAVTQTGGHAAELLSFGRKVGDRDRDGFSRWLGGRDCDDRNAEINPGARDVPGNSVDEDCSGSDLELDALRRLVGKGESRRPAAPSKELTKPTLPDDVSLLVISIDTWRWDAAGFMGYQRDITPNVDKLATQGTIYERAYGLGSYTGQAIPPLLTGKYASELKRNDRHEMRVSKDEKFAAELICNDKVRCAAIVSHQIFAPGFGWSQGFHEWNVIAQGEPRDETSSDLQFNSPLVAQQALRWLKKPENTAGRFWLWVHFMD